ncbi:MAG: hypothetical protein AMJ37_02095 [Dehalococcoidia bacterium DG_18]|nr:MAG: hypothetical protein AMJ37_02095 [Dehalococcoidia bacterium DG_18]
MTILISNFAPSEFDAYAQLVNEIDKVDRLGKATSVEHLKERLGQTGYHPGEDIFLAEMDGLLVGYAEILRELEIGRVILDGAIHPAYRTRGVGTRLLEIALDRSAELGAEVVQIPIAQRMQASQRFVRKRGFVVVRRHWLMTLTKYRGEALQLPQGFQLRPFLPGNEERLCAIQNLAFVGSWGFRPNTVDEIRYLVNTSLCHYEGIFFITEGEEVVGYCWTMDEPADKDKGYIRMMGVDPSYRGRGLGRASLVAGINYLQRRGMKAIEITVDSHNLSAKRLYQSVGFKRREVILWHERRLS